MPDLCPPEASSRVEPLPRKEVICRASFGNRKGPFCSSFGFLDKALFRTRTGDPLLTMEDSGFSDTANEQRLLLRFPCNTAGSSAHCTTLLEAPWVSPEVPEPVPKTCPQEDFLRAAPETSTSW